MYSVELYSRVRRACHVDGMSERAAAGHFGIDRKTVSKILKHAVPPGYRRNGPPARPKPDPFIPLINQILEEDKSRLKKQRHTARRIYERLRDEHGFTGGITIVTDYVREKKRRTREVFVPLSHAPGHAQVDFGEALGEIGGVVRGEFIDRRANIIALGPSGTGKTHIALGLGLAVCQKGRKVRFTTAAALVHELIGAVDERRLQRLQKQDVVARTQVVLVIGCSTSDLDT